jgi:hypothetical protein
MPRRWPVWTLGTLAVAVVLDVTAFVLAGHLHGGSAALALLWFIGIPGAVAAVGSWEERKRGVANAEAIGMGGVALVLILHVLVIARALAQSDSWF